MLQVRVDGAVQEQVQASADAEGESICSEIVVGAVASFRRVASQVFLAKTV